MANTITVGRMTFTSPASISFTSVQDGSRNSMDRNVSMSGQFVADTVSAAKVLRDELISMGNSNLILPFTYEGDDTFKGYAKISGVSVDSSKLGSGLFSYSFSLEIKGRESEMLFESNMSGALLTNSHSITSTTYAPWHALPVNAYNYNHEEAPVDVTRATENGNVAFYYDTNLRSKAAQWIVAPADYYKGGCKITIGNTLMTGYLNQNSPTGVTISNGIIRLTSGSTTDESRFTTEFYDNGTWTSDKEIAISYGSSRTEWKLWNTVQILRNEPHECVVRFTTYSDDNGDGRLTVDVSIKRGAHHASIVASQGATSDRSATGRINLEVKENGGTFSDDTGYMIEGSADSSGQKFIVGSPQGYTAVTSNKLIHLSTSQFKAFVGYEYNASSPQDIDSADAVRDQYLQSLYENVRLVRA
jgi:hypothetical protein